MLILRRCGARWRRLARFGVPLAGVALVAAAIIAVTLYSYRANRDDAFALSRNLVAAIDQRVQTEVEGYLDPAAQAVRTLARMRPDGGLSASGKPLLERLAQELLRDRSSPRSTSAIRRAISSWCSARPRGRSTPS